MKRIGVIGESPYDTNPLCKVWNTQFKNRGQFQLVLERIDGNNLESMKKMSRILAAELKSKKFDGFVFVRDLDAPRSDQNALNKRMNWFRALSSLVGQKSVFLLNIQEIEAMHFADLDTFNKEYKSKISFSGNPESKVSPKDELKRSTFKGKKKFQESDNEALVPKLDFTKVEQRCQFYRDFLTSLKTEFNL